MKQTLTVWVLIALTFGSSYALPLSGTYTIGGTTPDYTSISLAVTDLTDKGVSGPVTFNIRSNTTLNPYYLERISIPAIPGASATNTITFQAESGKAEDVIIAHAGGGTSTDHYVIRLSDADHIIFKHLTVQNLSQTYGSCIFMTALSDWNQVADCRIILDSTYKNVAYITHVGIMIGGVPAATSVATIIANTNSGNNNVIRDNIIKGGNYGIVITGRSSVNKDSGNVVLNNYVQTLNTGISVTFQKNLIASDNTLRVFGTDTKLQTGLTALDCGFATITDNNVIDTALNRAVSVNISNCDSAIISGNILKGKVNLSISDNRINGLYTVRLMNNVVKGPGLVYIDDLISSVISNNLFEGVSLRMENIKDISFYENKLYGPLRVVTCCGEISENLSFYNNYISYTGQPFSTFTAAVEFQNNLGYFRNISFFNNMIIAGSSTVPNSIGILMNDWRAERFHISHNSILSYAAMSSPVFQMLGEFHTDMFIQNNIFCHKGTGEAFYISTNKAKENNIIFDHNLLFTNGTFIARDLDFKYATLNDFQRVTGLGMNMITGEPKFVSNTDLHTVSAIAEGMGFPLSVQYDFDQDPRSLSFPDIGIDEYTVADEFDIGVLSVEPYSGYSSVYIKVNLVNKGTKSIKDSIIYLSYSTNGGTTWSAPEQVKVKSLINQYDEELYTFVNPWNIVQNGRFNVCVRVNLPGLIKETNKDNNMACGSICIAPPGGVFTVGTSAAANFSTLNAAVEYMKSLTCGINGPLVFNIEPGIYNEVLTIPVIEGASETNTITFQSSTGKAEDVIIMRNQDKPLSSVIIMLGTDHVIFQNLTVINSIQAIGKVFDFTNNSDYNTIRNCDIRIIGEDALYSPTTVCVYAEGSGNLIENNTITGGGCGITLQNKLESSGVNNIIRNNTINDPNLQGISVAYNKKIQIINNKVTMLTTVPAALIDAGIIVSDINSGIIDRNIIRNAGNFGISMTVASGLTVSNNFLYDFKPVADPLYGHYAIAINSGGGINIYHNTVEFAAASPDSSAPLNVQTSALFTGASVVGCQVVNNLFVNTGGGFAFFFVSQAALNFSDYNNFYSSGTALGRYGPSTDVKTLAEWVSKAKLDSHSISIKPVFASTILANDLHTLDPQLDKKGMALPAVTIDIDGHPRDKKTPDIGADEFILDPIDIAVADIEPKAASLGNNTVKAILRNEGLNSLAGSSVYLSYSTDDGLTWSVPEQFTSTKLTAFYDVEDFTFSTPWNISKLGAYKLKVRINAPGLAGDTVKRNDDKAIPVCMILKEGSYTVGGSAADFTDLSSLALLLNNLNCGIEGPVVFRIQPGIYEEQFSLPDVTGSSAANTITFESATGNAEDVVIRSQLNTIKNHYVVRLAGTRFTQFNNLTLENPAKNYATGVHLANGTDHISIRNCIINMDSSNLFGQTACIWASDSSALFGETYAGNLLIENNKLYGGNQGIRLLGASYNPSPGAIIENNTITSSIGGGISIEGYDEFLIHGNRISLYPLSGYSIGINASASGSKFQITANDIMHSGGIGMLLQNLDQQSPSFSKYSLVANNMIGGGFHSNVKGYGLFINRSGNIKIYHNSVLYDDPDTDSSFALYVKEGDNLHLKNNIFANSGNGYACYVHDPIAINTSDYNNLYTNGPVLGYWNNDQATLADLQNASGRDQQSVSIDPQFLSDFNLHTFNQQLDAKALAYSEVPTDRDGQFRDASSPDIGADEFSTGTDGGIITFLTPDTLLKKGVTYTITPRIGNYGNVPIGNFPVSWSIDNVLMAQEAFTLTIPGGSSAEFTFSATWTPAEKGEYLLCAKTNVPADLKAENDEFCIRLHVSDSINTVVENKPGDLVRVFPNPAKDMLFIQVPEGETYQVGLYNSIGQKMNYLEGNGLLSCNTSTWSPGIYIVRITGSEAYLNFRTIIITK